jgi:hypothetical protein
MFQENKKDCIREQTHAREYDKETVASGETLVCVDTAPLKVCCATLKMLFSAWCAWWAACSGIELLASIALVRESYTRFVFPDRKKFKCF